MFLLSLLLSGVLATTPATSEVAVPSESETYDQQTYSTLDDLDDVYRFEYDMSPELLSSIDELTTAWKSGILVKNGYVLTDDILNCLKKRCPDCSDDEIIRTFMAADYFEKTRTYMGYSCAPAGSVPGRLLKDVIHNGVEEIKARNRMKAEVKERVRKFLLSQQPRQS